MNLGLTLALVISAFVAVTGTAIYAGAEGMAAKPAPRWMYPLFFAVLFCVIFLLFWGAGFTNHQPPNLSSLKH